MIEVKLDVTDPIHLLAICREKCKELSMSKYKYVVNSATTSNNLTAIVLNAIKGASETEKQRLWKNINKPEDAYEDFDRFSDEDDLVEKDEYDPELLNPTKSPDFFAEDEEEDEEDGNEEDEEEDLFEHSEDQDDEDDDEEEDDDEDEEDLD